jgi:hypothetical protein
MTDMGHAWTPFLRGTYLCVCKGFVAISRDDINRKFCYIAN